MLAIADIEDALIVDIKANITGIKTVDTLEEEFSEETMANMILKDPFILIRLATLKPVESERGADGSSGVLQEQFALVIGSKSLRSRQEAQRGCYSIIDDLRERYNGGNQLVVDGTTVPLQFDGAVYLFRKNGTTVYAVWLGRTDN